MLRIVWGSFQSTLYSAPLCLQLIHVSLEALLSAHNTLLRPSLPSPSRYNCAFHATTLPPLGLSESLRLAEIMVQFVIHELATQYANVLPGQALSSKVR